MSDPVRLRVRLVPADPGDPVESGDPAADAEHDEVMAVAVEPEGTYRLESSSFFVPLAAGDLVRAAEDAAGLLQVVDGVAAQLNADQAAGRGEWILAAEPRERRREAQAEIDFELA